VISAFFVFVAVAYVFTDPQRALVFAVIAVAAAIEFGSRQKSGKGGAS